MAVIALILALVLMISFYSESHAIGVWIFMMIAHGALVEYLGPSAVHLPMYSGLIVMAITVIRRKWSGIPAAAWLLISLFASLIALAALTGSDPNGSIVRFLAYVKAFVLAIFIGGAIDDEKQLRDLSKYVIAAVFVGVVVAYHQYFSGSFEHVRAGGERAAGLAEDPNETAMLLLCGLPLTVYWITRSIKLRNRILLAAFLVSIFGAVALTQSRGGGVTLLLVSLLLFLRRPSVKTFAVGIILLSVVLLVIPDNYWERMNTVTELGDSDDKSLEYRLHYVQVGAEVFLRNPVLGVGLGNFGKALFAVDPTVNPAIVAHNMYLEFFVENGLFAGLLFLTILASALLYSMKISRYVPNEPPGYDLGFCYAISLVSVLLSALFLSVGYRPILWIFVGVGLACARIVRHRDSNRRLRAQQWPTTTENRSLSEFGSS